MHKCLSVMCARALYGALVLGVRVSSGSKTGAMHGDNARYIMRRVGVTRDMMWGTMAHVVLCAVLWALVGYGHAVEKKLSVTYPSETPRKSPCDERECSWQKPGPWGRCS
jgi:hypothetical protein